MRIDDEGHRLTDAELAKLEKRIRKEYRQAAKEMEKKAAEYFERFKAKDAKKKAQLEAGEITEAEYKKWRTGQMAIGQRWEEMRDTLAEDLSNSDKIARQMAYNEQPEIYALNHNYATFQVEHDSLIDTSYTLYDRRTVERLMMEDKDLLPPPSPKKQKELEEKGLRWNRQRVTSAVTQSILQGESIPNMAKRVATAICESNMKVATRNARTMATGAENRGKQDAFERAEEIGIDVKKEWLATLDLHTRESHVMADGMVVGLHDYFELMNGEVEYPGDPGGDPSEVYNCRCSMIPVVEGIDPRLEGERRSKLGDMTYEEWKDAHRHVEEEE